MEQRLIDANELLERSLRWPINSRQAVQQMIKGCPTIEAEPVRHGKWIIRDNPGTGWYRITCSVCDEDVTSTAPCIGFFPNVKVLWDYCPECGARMDKDV